MFKTTHGIEIDSVTVGSLPPRPAGRGITEKILMKKTILEKFFLSAGRAPRATMFYRLLALSVVCAAFGLLTETILGQFGLNIFAVVFLWGAAAILTQRMHDIGRTGYALLYLVIPVVGPVWLFMQMVKPGAQGSNKFGDNPLSRNDYLTVDIRI